MAPDVFYHLVRWTSVPLFSLYFRLTRQGVSHVPRTGAVLLAANHVSYLDPAVVGSACPRRVFFLMHEGTWAKPVMNWFFRGMQAIPVSRDASVRVPLRRALSRLEAGCAVGIFPEGARVRVSGDDALLGVALLARRSGAPVIPVGIAGTDRAMPVGAALPEPVRVRVAFGAPLRHDGARGGEDLRAADARFTRELMSSVRRLAAPVAAA